MKVPRESRTVCEDLVGRGFPVPAPQNAVIAKKPHHIVFAGNACEFVVTLGYQKDLLE
jgi:hypothetical protein